MCAFMTKHYVSFYWLIVKSQYYFYFIQTGFGILYLLKHLNPIFSSILSLQPPLLRHLKPNIFRFFISQYFVGFVGCMFVFVA